MSDLKVLFNPFRKRADNMSALFRYMVRVGWMLLSSTGVGCEGIEKNEAIRITVLFEQGVAKV